MHHAGHCKVHALGAAIMERIRDAMREASAGTRAEPVFLRRPEARQRGVSWHGFVGKCGFGLARDRPLA